MDRHSKSWISLRFYHFIANLGLWKSWSKCLKIWNIHQNFWLSQMSSHVSTKFISSIKIWCVIGWITEFSGPRTKIPWTWLSTKVNGWFTFLSFMVDVCLCFGLAVIVFKLRGKIIFKVSSKCQVSDYGCWLWISLLYFSLNGQLTIMKLMRFWQEPHCVEKGFNPVVSV